MSREHHDTNDVPHRVGDPYRVGDPHRISEPISPKPVATEPSAPARPWGGRPRRTVVAVGLGTTLATVAGLVIALTGRNPGGAFNEQAGAVPDDFLSGTSLPALPFADAPADTPKAMTSTSPSSDAPSSPDAPQVAKPPQVPNTPGAARPARAPTPPQVARPAQAPTPPQVARPAPVTYAATAGPGCGGATEFIRYGMYRDGRNGWLDYGDGRCGSSFVSVPMSGNAQREDPNAYTLWNFNTGPVTVGSCAVSVYVPNGDLTAVGGNPTFYRVSERGSAIGAFQVRQVAQRGRWVGVGTYRVTSGRLSVQMLNTGVNWNSQGATYAHHAAATIKAECTA